jgi:hypothetical protein
MLKSNQDLFKKESVWGWGTLLEQVKSKVSYLGTSSLTRDYVINDMIQEFNHLDLASVNEKTDTRVAAMAFTEVRKNPPDDM